jgi:hypothetical protein
MTLMSAIRPRRNGVHFRHNLESFQQLSAFVNEVKLMEHRKRMLWNDVETVATRASAVGATCYEL